MPSMQPSAHGSLVVDSGLPKFYDAAVAIPSPVFETLARTARENHVFLSLGSIEKEGGTLYCTAILLDRDVTLLYKYRKLIPTAAERLIWGSGSGDGLIVADSAIGKVGGLICWKNYMPAARLALCHKGIENSIAPNADDLPSYVATMQRIAKEGRCFVINSNQFCNLAYSTLPTHQVSLFPSDYPPFAASNPSDRKPDGTAWTADDVLSHGGSCVIGPLGTFLAEPVWGNDETVYAQLRMGELTEAKMEYLLSDSILLYLLFATNYSTLEICPKAR